MHIEAVKLERPGVKACGPFKAGQVYKVGETVGGIELTPAEAERLVKVKGFTSVKAERAAKPAAPEPDKTVDLPDAKASRKSKG